MSPVSGTHLDALGGRPYLRRGWPILVVLYGYMVFWALGLSNFMWIVVAVPMLFTLILARRVRMPGGAGIWFLFLGWTLLSLATVGTAPRATVWVYRSSVYAASGIAFVYAYNLPREVSDRSIVRAISTYWVIIVLSGLVSLAFPLFAFRSPIQALLPESLSQDAFVVDLIHPRLAQVHDFLGFEVTRPAAPFAYTNGWGSNVALLAPLVIAWASMMRGWKRSLVIFLGMVAIVPVVQSLNRGLWVSLSVGLLYAGLRFALSGLPRPLITMAIISSIIAIISIVTPLASLVGARLETGHSDNRRLSLYEQSIDAAFESPLIGHGGPIPDATDPSGPPVGTHGQIWILLVSHGFPAALAFLSFFAYMLIRTGSDTSNRFVFWVHIMLVIAVVQMPFYFLIPSQLPVLMVAAGLALRQIAVRHDANVPVP